jgi:hypothetical protein
LPQQVKVKINLSQLKAGVRMMDGVPKHNTRSVSQFSKGLQRLEETVDGVARGMEGEYNPRRGDPQSMIETGDSGSEIDKGGRKWGRERALKHFSKINNPLHYYAYYSTL